MEQECVQTTTSESSNAREQESVETDTPKSPSRRKFIEQVGVSGAIAIAAGVTGVEPLLKTERSSA